MNDKSENILKLDTKDNDYLWNLIDNLGLQPWHLFLIFGALLILCILTCIICTVFKKCLAMKEQDYNTPLLLQNNFHNDSMTSSQISSEIVSVNHSTNAIPFLKYYSAIRI